MNEQTIQAIRKIIRNWERLLDKAATPQQQQSYSLNLSKAKMMLSGYVVEW